MPPLWRLDGRSSRAALSVRRKAKGKAKTANKTPAKEARAVRGGQKAGSRRPSSTSKVPCPKVSMAQAAPRGTSGSQLACSGLVTSGPIPQINPAVTRSQAITTLPKGAAVK